MIKVKITIDHSGTTHLVPITIGDDELTFGACCLIDFEKLFGIGTEVVVKVLKHKPSKGDFLTIRMSDYDFRYKFSTSFVKNPLQTLFSEYEIDAALHDFFTKNGFTDDQLESGIYVVPA